MAAQTKILRWVFKKMVWIAHIINRTKVLFYGLSGCQIGDRYCQIGDIYPEKAREIPNQGLFERLVMNSVGVC